MCSNKTEASLPTPQSSFLRLTKTTFEGPKALHPAGAHETELSLSSEGDQSVQGGEVTGPNGRRRTNGQVPQSEKPPETSRVCGTQALLRLHCELSNSGMACWVREGPGESLASLPQKALGGAQTLIAQVWYEEHRASLKNESSGLANIA